MSDDAVFNQAVDFLENGGNIPKSTTNKFLAACLREIHGTQKDLRRDFKALKNNQETHHVRITTIETILKISGLTTMSGGVLFFVLKLTGVL